MFDWLRRLVKARAELISAKLFVFHLSQSLLICRTILASLDGAATAFARVGQKWTAAAAPVVYEWAIKAAIVLAVIWLIFMLSVFTYLLFYWLWIAPPASLLYTTALHFAYPDRSAVDLQATMTKSKELAAQMGPLTAIADADKAAAFRDLGAALYPVARACLGPLTIGTKYDYVLNFVLPESPVNLEVGEFTTRLFVYHDGTIAPANPHFPPASLHVRHQDERASAPEAVEQEAQKIIAESGRQPKPVIAHRSFTLKYKSYFIKSLRSLIFALPSALGLSWFDEVQTFEAILLQNHAYSGESGEICLAVTVNNPRLQIYSAELAIVAKLEGVRYYCYHWFWTCFTLGTLTIFSFYVILAAAFFATLFVNAQHERERQNIVGELGQHQRFTARKGLNDGFNDMDELSSSSSEKEPVEISALKKSPKPIVTEQLVGDPVEETSSTTEVDSSQTGKDKGPVDTSDEDSAAGTGLKKAGPPVGLSDEDIDD